jgi:hypothetical protein
VKTIVGTPPMSNRIPSVNLLDLGRLSVSCKADTQIADLRPLSKRIKGLNVASLIEVWIDEGERRTWFLAEIIHDI